MIVPTTNRRGLLLGLGGVILAAPAIVRVSSIMPVKSLPSGFPADWEVVKEWLMYRAVFDDDTKLLEVIPEAEALIKYGPMDPVRRHIRTEVEKSIASQFEQNSAKIVKMENLSFGREIYPEGFGPEFE